jgi:hypothetical protein
LVPQKFLYRQKEVLKRATKIAERYMGKRNAKIYGRANSAEGTVLVRIRLTRILAEKDIYTNMLMGWTVK